MVKTISKKYQKEDIIDKLEKSAKQINKLGITKIGLFGSYLKGEQTQKSDVDILVEFDKPSFERYAEALIMLEKVLKKKVDLVTKSSLRPEMRYVAKEAEYVRI